MYLGKIIRLGRPFYGSRRFLAGDFAMGGFSGRA
jgi:hypothetical protein